MLRRARMSTILTFLLAVALPASAQTNGRIQGRVIDTQGSVIAGAQVTVEGDGNGFRATTQSDDNGWFSVASLAPGAYRVEARITGRLWLLSNPVYLR